MTLYKAIRSFKGDCMKINNNVKDYQKKANEHTEEMYKVIEKMSDPDDQFITDDMSKAEVLYRASKYLAGEYSAAAGNSVKAIDKVRECLFSFSKKFESKGAAAKREQFHKDLAKHSEINQRDSDKEATKAFNKARQDAYNKRDIENEVNDNVAKVKTKNVDSKL
jgi:hypothetical protein